MPASTLGILRPPPLPVRASKSLSSSAHPDIEVLVVKLNDPERWLLRQGLRLVAGTSRRSIFGAYSWWSLMSALSAYSLFAALSFLAVASLLSTASVASLASIGSVGSVASVGSVFSIRCVGGYFQVC